MNIVKKRLIRRIAKENYSKMTYTDDVEKRYKQLNRMDDFIRGHEGEGDYDIVASWLMCGIPDGHSSDDIWDIARDEKAYTETLDLFNRIVDDVNNAEGIMW